MRISGKSAIAFSSFFVVGACGRRALKLLGNLEFSSEDAVEKSLTWIHECCKGSGAPKPHHFSEKN